MIQHTPFEKWARSKGMLIDKNGEGAYKSLETRAYADTWKAAQQYADVCVNACEPLERPMTQIPALIKLADECVALRQQKSDLVFAMRDLIDRTKRIDERLLVYSNSGIRTEELGEVARALALLKRVG